MEAVGYDLYCKMLNEAVKHLKGEMEEEETFTTTMDLNVDAFIPASYISNEYQKLDVYKRIAAIESRGRNGRYGRRTDRPVWRYSEEGGETSGSCRIEKHRHISCM